MWQHWSIPQYSPDLAPANFTCSLHWNQYLKGRRFCNATDTIKNTTKSWKRFHKMTSWNVSNTFTVAATSVHVELHNGAYFEGYVAYMIVLLCIAQKYSDSGNIMKLPCIPCFRSPVPGTAYTNFKLRINGRSLNETTVNFQDRSHTSSCWVLRLPTFRNSLLSPSAGSKQYNNALYRLLKTWTHWNHGIL